ncbi:MAG: glycerol-3-phosphate 1-O-acyltransferase PlsY [Sulfurimonadaceae bacterium]
MHITLIVILVIFAYLLGSIATAIITCKLMGLPDPRTEGSENPGATNVLKIGGKKAAIITLFGDLLKGLIPVLIGVLLGADELTLSLIAMAAFLGHLYPIFYSFRGGKGVATAFGVILGLSWPVAVAMLFSWLSVYYLFKLSSLGALITALVTPLYFYFIDGSIIFTIMSGLLSAMLILRHRSNIEKIIDGTED